MYIVILFRYTRRNEQKPRTKLIDQNGNKEFISGFEEWHKIQVFETSQESEDTVRKNIAYLFSYEDSLLSFNTKKFKDYNLQKHVELSDDGSILEVSDPTALNQWLQSIVDCNGNPMPARRREMLKAHARFRDYIQEKVSSVNFGPEVEAFVKRDSILNNLKNISDQIKKKRCFYHLGKQEELERKKTKLARKIVDPAEDHKETKAVETWFASSEHEVEEKKNMETYNKAMAERKVSSKGFNSFGVWAKFTLSAVDKSRRGAYNFTNEDFAGREPKWLPDGNLNNDDDTDDIEMIPDGWNPSEAPEEGMEPSCWVVRVPGDRKGMKLRRNTDIVLTKKVLDICLKYQDLKEIIF